MSAVTMSFARPYDALAFRPMGSAPLQPASVPVAQFIIRLPHANPSAGIHAPPPTVVVLPVEVPPCAEWVHKGGCPRDSCTLDHPQNRQAAFHRTPCMASYGCEDFPYCPFKHPANMRLSTRARPPAPLVYQQTVTDRAARTFHEVARNGVMHYVPVPAAADAPRTPSPPQLSPPGSMWGSPPPPYSAWGVPSPPHSMLGPPPQAHPPPLASPPPPPPNGHWGAHGAVRPVLYSFGASQPSAHGFPRQPPARMVGVPGAAGAGKGGRKKGNEPHRGHGRRVSVQMHL